MSKFGKERDPYSGRLKGLTREEKIEKSREYRRKFKATFDTLTNRIPFLQSRETHVSMLNTLKITTAYILYLELCLTHPDDKPFVEPFDFESHVWRQLGVKQASRKARGESREPRK